MSLVMLRVAILSLLLVCITMPFAHAEVTMDLKDGSKWNIGVGGFWATTDTTVRVDAVDGSFGTEINAEDDLAWDDRDFSPFITLGYRFNKNHSLLASYWSIRRDGVKVITIDLDIGDETYTLGSTIDSQFVTDIYRVTYGYHFYDSDKWSIAFLGGLHITNLKFNIRAVGGMGATVQEAADAAAPLPTFGFSASYKINKNWYASGWFQGLTLEYEDFKGKMLNASMAVTYKPWKNWAISTGVTSFDINVSSTDSDARGEFDYEYIGPIISLHSAF